jgi:hypothetical protein
MKISSFLLDRYYQKNFKSVDTFDTEIFLVSKVSILKNWYQMDALNQIDHCLIDGQHFSEDIDIKVWKGANIDSEIHKNEVQNKPSKQHDVTTAETFRSRVYKRWERSNNVPPRAGG